MSGELTDGSMTAALAALVEPAVALVLSNKAFLKTKKITHGSGPTAVDYTVG